MGILTGLEPATLLNHFENIAKIPHGSGNEGKLKEYIIHLAKAHGLTYWQDKKGNLMVYVTSSGGCEDVPSVLFQAHLDMVCVCAEGVTHDFEKEPLEIYIENIENKKYLRARGTTLGADNAVGIVAMLALMEDRSIIHPPLELLFTVEEESGLVGIREVEFKRIYSRRMINMDCGDPGEICVSTAGAAYCRIMLPVAFECAENKVMMHIRIDGLTGGHSGLRIGLGRASAPQLLGRLIFRMVSDIEGSRIVSLECPNTSGIVKQCSCVIAYDENDADKVIEIIDRLTTEYIAEYRKTDPNMRLSYEKTTDSTIMDEITSRRVAKFLFMLPAGVIKRDPDEADVVVCSTNTTHVYLKDGMLTTALMIRSSVDEMKWELIRKMQLISELFGGTFVIDDCYGGWPYKQDSELQLIFREAQKRLYGNDLRIVKAHSCAETGIVAAVIPDMDIVGIAPDSKGAHTVDEYMNIDSMEPFWVLIKEALRAMCEISKNKE